MAVCLADNFRPRSARSTRFPTAGWTPGGDSVAGGQPSNAILECLAAQIPFLSSRSGGIPEAIAAEDVDRVTFAVDPLALAERLGIWRCARASRSRGQPLIPRRTAANGWRGTIGPSPNPVLKPRRSSFARRSLWSAYA